MLLAGVLRLGRTISYIPWPVIEGFTLGIAIIIFLQQIPTATGTKPGDSTNAAVAAVQSLMSVAWPKLGWSLLLVAVVATRSSSPDPAHDISVTGGSWQGGGREDRMQGKS